MYLGLILFNALATAFYLVFSSKLMKRTGISPNLTIAFVHLSAAIVLFGVALLEGAPFWPVARSAAVIWLFVASGLKLLSKEMHFYAYSKVDVAQVTVFSAFVPIFGIFFGSVLLKERMSPLEITGTGIICLSIYLLFLQQKDNCSRVKALLTPLIEMRSLPILMAFLSTIPPALSAVYMKKSALIMNHLYFALFSTFLIGLAALFMEGGRGGAKKIIVGWKTISLTKFVLLGILLAFAQYSFVVLLTMEDISHTIALQPLGIIFQMILAYFLIGERQKPFKRLIFGGFIVFGSILLEMGRH